MKKAKIKKKIYLTLMGVVIPTLAITAEAFCPLCNCLLAVVIFFYLVIKIEKEEEKEKK